MLKYYPKYMWRFIGWVFGSGLLLMIIAMLPGNDSNDGIWGTAAFAVMLLAAVMVRNSVATNYNQQIAILNDACRPAEYIANNEKAFARAQRRSQKGNGEYAAWRIQLDYSVALYADGRYDAAIGVMKKLLEGGISLPTRLAAYDRLANYFCARNEEGDLDKAREYLSKAKQLVAECRESGKTDGLRGVADLIYIEYCIEAKADEPSDGTLEYFEKLTEAVLFRRGELSARYHLAEIYEKRGDAAASREQLRIVAERGAELEIGRRAAAKIADKE